ncbi:MAG: N-acetyl-gamma-glutamyl-phosphate reductase [Proteobacteria bacterium]|nr:N-acetyl-gamma-glutamyl-phosphate reductase [Pseudomonadota bacterium]
MQPTVFVDGQDGTTGLRIHELLAARQDLTLLRIAPELRKDPAERARLLNAADVAFLCLPDAAARESAALVTNPRTCLIDASTAHRTDPAWVYGFPEWGPERREALRSARRIANPGCHATGFIALVRPLVAAGLAAPDTPLAATSLTGYTGGGKAMMADYAATPLPAALTAPRPYALGLAHKHLPEMRAQCGLAHAPTFMPVVGPFAQGLAVSVPLHRSQVNGDATALHAALAAHYAGERFVRLLPLGDLAAATDGGFYDVQACNDTNRIDLAVFAGGEHLLLMARLDNLGKGASGAAVQCMNLRLGLDEDRSLRA